VANWLQRKLRRLKVAVANWWQRGTPWLQPPWSKVIIVAVGAVALAALTVLLWPTIQMSVESNTGKLSQFWWAAIVAVTFSLIALLVYSVAKKTLWDLMQLLIVPVALASIGFVFTTQQEAHQQEIENKRAQAQREIEDKRAQAERELAKQNAQAAALQAYLDQMSTLLVKNDLRTSAEESEVRTVAQARTATVLQRLDADANRNVIRFLNEARLTRNGQSSINLLAGADLQGANLEGVDLSNVDLSSTILKGATLSDAFLADAKLRGANLTNAYMYRADLSYATLNNAVLRGANLELTNLWGADLYGADLSDADLDSADLRHSALSNANLREATLTSTFLDNAKLSDADLRGAILSNTKLKDADLRGIFEDDFSNTFSGWPTTGKTSKSDPYIMEYASDGLRVYDATNDGTLYALNKTAGSAIEDAVIEVDATVNEIAPEDQDTHWGIICRAVDYNNYYELGITAAGHPIIWRLKDNHWKELRTENSSDAVHSRTDTYHLRAECWGSTLTLYVNGQRVFQKDDSELKSGQVGLYVNYASNENPVDILFDDFVVKGPKVSLD